VTPEPWELSGAQPYTVFVMAKYPNGNWCPGVTPRSSVKVMEDLEVPLIATNDPLEAFRNPRLEDSFDAHGKPPDFNC
jgi:hypothetical protein